MCQPPARSPPPSLSQVCLGSWTHDLCSCHFPHLLGHPYLLPAYPVLPTSQTGDDDSHLPGSFSLGTGIPSCSSLQKHPHDVRGRPSASHLPMASWHSRSHIQTPQPAAPRTHLSNLNPPHPLTISAHYPATWASSGLRGHASCGPTSGPLHELCRRPSPFMPPSLASSRDSGLQSMPASQEAALFRGSCYPQSPPLSVDQNGLVRCTEQS